MKMIFKIFLTATITCLVLGIQAQGQTQLEALHGDETYSASGLHSGNQIRTTFWNDGQVGTRTTSPEDIGGEWPINSGRNYLAKMATMYNAEVRDADGILRHIQSESNGTRTGGLDGSASNGDWGPNGEWWTMAPLPGFFNESPDEADSPKPRVAMSHWRWSWPSYWPDKFDDAVDPGWPQAWDGYFGKDVLNADQESYYVIDDYDNSEFNFYPDSTDSLRRGLGLRVTVRGFQWSNVLVQDILFLLYDVKNIGTYDHNKLVFGIMAGPNIGSKIGAGGDGDDDGGAYDLEHNLGYQYDADDIGGGGWSPVGRLGLAFFESPGNPFDGIDNDGDGELGSGNVIDASMFDPIVYSVGDPVVLVDYTTFERTVVPMPAEGVTTVYQDIATTYMPNTSLVEIANNLIDDNLNGIIDENNGSVTDLEDGTQIQTYLYEGLKYVDYFSGQGEDNILIDERRDDFIDNDGDWNILTDDVGLDGVARTGDIGEGDGMPSSGAGTNLPGEPHIDKTDIDESDMIGLTCFNIYSPWEIYPLYDDETLWSAMTPGFLNAYGQIGNTDVLLASGYFPLKPQQIERFSVGYIMGYGDELFRNRDFGEKTYEENYNFAKAPNIPTVTAIPGDKRVTLYWDDYAEQSIDPITGHDFQGYRIYRSTDPAWNDMAQVTDGYGAAAYQKPVEQYDLDDGVMGYSNLDVNGVQFYLGDDTGIVHAWTDTTVKNGQLYYYAVTAYDGGSDSLGITPSETSKYISISKDGTIDKGDNVVLARPEAPSLGFADASLNNLALMPGGKATGLVGYEIIDPNLVKNDVTYQLVFEDTIVTASNKAFAPMTKNFSLLNTMTGDTLINKSTNLAPGADQPMIDGFKISLYNAAGLSVKTDSTFWSDDSVLAPQFTPFKYSRTVGMATPNDYLVEFGEVGMDTSIELAISKTRSVHPTPVNFRVTNTLTDEYVDFGFWERDALAGEEGKFTGFSDRSRTDQIIFFEKDLNDSLVISWNLQFDLATNDSLHRNPRAGDTLHIKTTKPFLSNDVFEFTTTAPHVDEALAGENMDAIRVVPNPYVVANSFEPLNPYVNGRGPRELHFIHLPAKCTIKIFNIRGQLVREIQHDTQDMSNGTEIWDMLSKDQLEISYGIYIYYVDAGSIGQKTGKFAIIK